MVDMAEPKLLATSDLHIGYAENREVAESLRPTTEGDWLIVAGDIAERFADVEWLLRLVAERFAKVIWVPGNHELWTVPHDPVQAKGVGRYGLLVEMCRGVGVLTPEDEFAIWPGSSETGPLVVAPLFQLYDYTFCDPGMSKDAALARAYAAGVVCTDERVLFPDPHPSRDEWCRERLAYSRSRLDGIPGDMSTVLISHWPLHRGPTEILRYPEFAIWCGTTATADWHIRYRAAVAVYGHLHIPRTQHFDGTRFEEVSLGYPREWRPRSSPTVVPRVIF